MSRWDDEEDESSVTNLAPRSKWDDEEDSDTPVLDSWDASDDEENKPVVPAPQPKKKVPLSQKIAEREAQKQMEKEEALRKLRESETPEERRARLQQIELEADLNNAADLFGTSVSLKDDGVHDALTEQEELEMEKAKKEVDLESLSIFRPKTKSEFEALSEKLGSLLSALSHNPHYNTVFLPTFLRTLALPLNSEQVRKNSSILTAISNEKIREERAADKPKTKKKSKPALTSASAKVDDSVDTTNYSRYDDFDDFM
ncbi:eukaryotic translation initiation factor 3 subunit J [Dipodascopsis uninucleata]